MVWQFTHSPVTLAKMGLGTAKIWKMESRKMDNKRKAGLLETIDLCFHAMVGLHKNACGGKVYFHYAAF